MKCKICGDPIKRCPRKETNNWCHTWHHDHAPKPEIKINYYNVVAIFLIITVFTFIIFTILPNIQNGINNIKIPSIPKNQPCVTQTSYNNGMMGTISSGDCSELQKKRFSSDEEKLIGTWSIKTQVLDGSFTLNSDRSGVFVSPIYGKMYFKWKASNGILYTDNIILNPLSGGTPYKLINNDKTITVGNVMSFDKSWW